MESIILKGAISNPWAIGLEISRETKPSYIPSKFKKMWWDHQDLKDHLDSWWKSKYIRDGSKMFRVKTSQKIAKNKN